MKYICGVCKKQCHRGGSLDHSRGTRDWVHTDDGTDVCDQSQVIVVRS